MLLYLRVVERQEERSPFPRDVRFSIDHALLKILEPKTRFRAACHQSSKLEPQTWYKSIGVGLAGHMSPFGQLHHPL